MRIKSQIEYKHYTQSQQGVVFNQQSYEGRQNKGQMKKYGNNQTIVMGTSKMDSLNFQKLKQEVSSRLLLDEYVDRQQVQSVDSSKQLLTFQKFIKFIVAVLVILVSVCVLELLQNELFNSNFQVNKQNYIKNIFSAQKKYVNKINFQQASQMEDKDYEIKISQQPMKYQSPIHQQSNSEQNNLKSSNKKPKNNEQISTQNQALNRQLIQVPKCHIHFLEKRQSLLKQKGRLYDFLASTQLMKKYSHAQNFVDNTLSSITKEQFSLAIQLLALVHHVNNQGNINVSENEQCQTVAQKKERLTLLVQKQKNRLNKLYHIGSYKKHQLRFCIVINSYNNAQSGLIYRNIDSILQQNYKNFHVVYTDDFSSDKTAQKVQQYLKKRKVSKDLFKIKINQKKVGMMENIYKAITNDCKQGEIAVMLDGDDSFIGTNVLSLLNAIYQKQKIALMWNNFITIHQNYQVSVGFSSDYIQEDKHRNSFRQKRALISSHLKSFYVDLFRKIKIQDLQQNDGRFYGGASDTAMMIPMLEMANPRIKYVPQILYEYRVDTGQTGMKTNVGPQKRALRKIFDSHRYQRIEDFSFIEKSILKARHFGRL